MSLLANKHIRLAQGYEMSLIHRSIMGSLIKLLIFCVYQKRVVEFLTISFSEQ